MLTNDAEAARIAEPRLVHKFRLFLAVCFVLSFLAACSPRLINQPESFAASKALGSATTYTFANWINKDHQPALAPDLIIVTLSGGGIRAAALAASTLNELGKFAINGRPLTDNIIVVSSTSGGSIAAAWLAARGFDHYADFRHGFLEKNNDVGLFFSGFGPKLVNDRSAILQDFVEKRFAMNGMTFDQLLQKPAAPFFVFNSTDVAGDHVFTFTQSDFDLICTDLGKIPVSTGMTASSALPFVLTDVELKNHWDACGLHGYKDAYMPQQTRATDTTSSTRTTSRKVQCRGRDRSISISRMEEWLTILERERSVR
jgi:hypothetical protein